MIPLTIDYKNIVQKYKKYLPKLIAKTRRCYISPKGRHALVLGMTNASYKKFDSQPSGIPKIKYMNTENFLNGIVAYGFYTSKIVGKICGRSKEKLLTYIRYKELRKKLRFDKNTLSKLRELTRKKKETSGNLRITKDGKIVGGSNYKVGRNEKAHIVNGLCSFHTHTEDAYKRHEVNVGWPSGDDYAAFLQTVEHHNTLFHCIITVEGIYIVSMKDNIPITSKTYKEVYKKYDIPYPDISKHPKKIIRKYVTRVNKGIFNVKFLPWPSSQRPFSL